MYINYDKIHYADCHNMEIQTACSVILVHYLHQHLLVFILNWKRNSQMSYVATKVSEAKLSMGISDLLEINY